jgi:hypothetical protein
LRAGEETDEGQLLVNNSFEPIPPTPSARWALASARADGAIPADYDFSIAGSDTVIRWRQPVVPGGYDEVEIDAAGRTFYRLDGKLHRLDGPAVVHVTRRSWFVLGREYPDRASWFAAAVLTVYGLAHLGEYIDAAVHADVNPTEAAVGYRHGIPVGELSADRGLLRELGDC